jgi:hypothetical protein
MNPDEIIPPFGLGGLMQDATALQEHQHRFVFELSRDAALRGCETCGKAWMAPRLGHALWGSWQEVREEDKNK